MELKTLISLYIKLKLRENGFLPNEFFPVLESSEKEILSAALVICSEIEEDARFSDVLSPFRRFGIELETFNVVVEELLVSEMNWPRVMSLVSLTGVLAIECMERGDEHKVDFIQDWAGAFAEEKMNPWIENNGGLVL